MCVCVCVQLLTEAMMGRQEWGPAFALTKRHAMPNLAKQNDILQKWNAKIQQSPLWGADAAGEASARPLEVTLIMP